MSIRDQFEKIAKIKFEAREKKKLPPEGVISIARNSNKELTLIYNIAPLSSEEIAQNQDMLRQLLVQQLREKSVTIFFRLTSGAQLPVVYNLEEKKDDDGKTAEYRSFSLHIHALEDIERPVGFIDFAIEKGQPVAGIFHKTNHRAEDLGGMGIIKMGTSLIIQFLITEGVTELIGETTLNNLNSMNAREDIPDLLGKVPFITEKVPTSDPNMIRMVTKFY